MQMNERRRHGCPSASLTGSVLNDSVSEARSESIEGERESLRTGSPGASDLRRIIKEPALFERSRQFSCDERQGAETYATTEAAVQ